MGTNFVSSIVYTRLIIEQMTITVTVLMIMIVVVGYKTAEHYGMVTEIKKTRL
jgi:hypothetical protein